LASGYINLHCCTSYVLSHEPDFEEQEEWLTQVVHQEGFEIIFYPKYHCELNYIEMIYIYIYIYMGLEKHTIVEPAVTTTKISRNVYL
jgi:hypothetical protein